LAGLAVEDKAENERKGTQKGIFAERSRVQRKARKERAEAARATEAKNQGGGERRTYPRVKKVRFHNDFFSTYHSNMSDDYSLVFM
jgi:hypothetical protein